MTALPTYAALSAVHRGKPCAEYPGLWIVYLQRTNGPFGARQSEEIGTHATFDAAFTQAQHVANVTSERVSISWACSDDDPRVGQTWFTGYYSAGHFDSFGRWVTS